MALISGVGHLDTGHDGFAPRAIENGMSGYTINGIDIATVGSTLPPHSKPKNPPHPGVVATGSARYTIRGIPIARVGDAISCGGTIAEGFSGYDIQ